MIFEASRIGFRLLLAFPLAMGLPFPMIFEASRIGFRLLVAFPPATGLLVDENGRNFDQNWHVVARARTSVTAPPPSFARICSTSTKQAISPLA
jgi:hypothetical protein